MIIFNKVVSNANAKEFIGKNEVTSKILENKSAHTKALGKTQTLDKKPTVNTKSDTKVISSNSKDDEWAIF